MSLESALFTLITTNDPVAAVMGTRLYPDVIPQDQAMPAGHYRTVTNRPATAHSGAAGVEFSTVRFSIFAPLRADAIALRELIKPVVNGYKGTAGGETLDAVFYREGVNTFDVESGLYAAQFDLIVTRRV